MTQRSRLSKAAVSLSATPQSHHKTPPATFWTKLWEADFYFNMFHESLGLHSGSGSFLCGGFSSFLPKTRNHETISNSLHIDLRLTITRNKLNGYIFPWFIVMWRQSSSTKEGDDDTLFTQPSTSQVQRGLERLTPAQVELKVADTTV